MKRSKGVASQHSTRRAQEKALNHKAPAAIASRAARVTAEGGERASAETLYIYVYIYIYMDHHGPFSIAMSLYWMVGLPWTATRGPQPRFLEHS